ncbi:MAG: segregation/condensation protein A [bacterium]
MFKLNLDIYEGSIEEMLVLVKKRKLSPLEFEMAKITSSYLSYLKLQSEIELEKTPHFLVFLSELLLIKSYVLLPRPQVIEEGDNNLICYFKEYEGYKKASFWIEERFKEQEAKIPISFKQKDIEEEITVSIFDLFSSLKDILSKNKESPVYELVIDEPKIEEAIERIKKMFFKIKKIEIAMLFDVGDRLSLIVTFLAILELIRLRFLRAIQYKAFSSIWLIRTEGRG